MRALSRTLGLIAIALAVGCGGGSSQHDDAGHGHGHDAGGAADASRPADASQPSGDASQPSGDAGPRADGGGGTRDGGGTTPGAGTVLAGCDIFPADNPWNQDVSSLPLHPRAAQILAQMNPTRGLHPDWGNWSTDHYGIPWASGMGAPALPITWTASWGPTESDMLACPGGGGDFCYPIPSDAPIEGGSGAATDADRHVLYLDTSGAPSDCTLYELYNAQNFSGGGWTAANGAIFHLGSNDLRPEGWTSADAAGLPILPGLVRVDEVMAGEIHHAMRFTMQHSARAYIHPATHAAGRSGTDLPPMGLRLRLRADYPVDSAPASAQVILRAMQTYGLILADNGSDWYISGDSDDRWDAIIDDVISGLRDVHGSDFEVLDTGASMPQ